MDINRKRTSVLFSFVRLFAWFVFVFLLIQVIRTIYWYMTDQFDEKHFILPTLTAQSRQHNPAVKFIDRDTYTKMLEKYIFQPKQWTFPEVDIDPTSATIVKRATIIDRNLLKLIPTLNISKNIECEKIIENNSSAIKTAKRYMSTHPKNMNFENLVKSSMNCNAFIRRRGYITSPMTEEEQNFPVAYGILIYKDVEMVERLLRAIYRPQNFYCLHVDAKSDLTFYLQIQALTKCFKNVFIASSRTDVRWGTLSLLLSDLLCMRDLFKYKWKYYINLTGQEFPIKNNYELVQVMKSFNGGNDLESTFDHRNNERLTLIHDIDGKRTGYKLPPVPLDITVVKGNMHGALSRGFVDFLLNNAKSKIFFDWVKNTGMPEETYFATINSNPHLGAPGSFTGTNLERRVLFSREILWYKDCGGKLVRGVCINGLEDLKRLTKSRKLFLNKFHLDFEYLAFDCFEKWFYDQSRLTYSGQKGIDKSLYTRAVFVKHSLISDPDQL